MKTHENDSRAALRAMGKAAAEGHPPDVSVLSTQDIELLLQECGAYQVELEASNARLRVLYNMSPTGYITLSKKGIVVEANTVICKMLDAEKSTVLGKPFIKHLTKESADLFYISQKVVLDNQVRDTCVIQFAGKQDKWYQTESVPLSLPGFEKQALCTMVLDVTENQRAKDVLIENETVRKILAERTLLLKEVHHRVKNNLQVLMSLINLQVAGLPDDECTRPLIALRNRIRAISLVHERIYQSENLSEVPMEAYISTLAQEIAASYLDSGVKATISVDVDGTALGVDKAIPVGLLLTELVSNVFKHAFDLGTPGDITISLRSDSETCRIAVEDDGKGLPEGFSIEGSTSMGMQIVNALAGQLHATVKAVSAKHGTRFEMDLPVKN